ncbi:MAG: SpoIIE family protein phosphatase [Phycisphaerae bacterium]
MHLEVTDTRTLTDDTPDVRDMEFHDQPVSVGSHSANTVQLPDIDVAPYHAMIVPVTDGQWMYQPTIAGTFTLVNGERTTGQVPLDHGDVIVISHFEIKFTLDAEVELELPEVGNLDELTKIREHPLPPRSDVTRGEDDITLTPTRQRVLAGFGAKLSTCTTFPELLECTLTMLLSELGARTVWMGVRRAPHGELEFVDGRSDKGKYAGEPAMLDTFVYRCLTRRQFIRIPRTGAKDTQSVLAVPIIGGQGAMGLVVADTRRRTRVFDESDVDFLTITSRFVASQTDAIIAGQAVQRDRLSASELALLHTVQAQLDPRNAPQWPQLQVAVFAKPGTETSGDVYDVTRLPNGLASVLIGHVHGEKIRTALGMTEVRTAFRMASMHADPPHIQLKALNWLLYDEKFPCALDAAIIVMNPATGAAEYATAGRIGAIIIDERGYARSLMVVGAPPAGAGKAAAYGPHKDRVGDRETLAFFTPGSSTVRNEAGTCLGEERLVDALCDGFGQSASAALDGVIVDLAAFLKQGTPPDDITILLIHRDPSGM